MFARASLRSIRRMNNARTYTTSPIFKQFDKSILYPTFLVVLLGSQIMNVVNAQGLVEDLERRYKLKMTKIDDLKVRLENGELVDVEKEMSLVNRLFERSTDKKYLKSTSDKFGSQFGVTERSHENLEDSDIVSSLDGNLTDEALNKMLGLDPLPTEKNTKKQSSSVPKSEALEPLSKDELQIQVENEKELTQYRLKPSNHLLMEQPGDYVNAAKDTKVTEFL